MMFRILIFSAILWLSGCVHLVIENRPIPCKNKHVLRFATYNTFCENGHKQNLNKIFKIVHEINPDIMVFQECQCFSHMVLKQYLGNLYPFRYFVHYNDGIEEHDDGLCLISKYPIVKNQIFPPIYGWSPCWLFIIKTPQGCLQVLNVHLNPKLARNNSVGLLLEGVWATPAYRLNEVGFYRQILNPNLPTIIAGDFNESDDGSANCYLRRNHFNDALLCYVPQYIKTWHWKIGGFMLTGRYDRIYSTEDLHILSCQVVQKGESDHFPVIVNYCENK